MTRTVRYRSSGFRALIAGLITLGLTLTGLPMASASTSAPAAPAAIDTSSFDPGFIVSDRNFWDGNAMTPGQIQDFLNSKVSACAAGYTCLRNLHGATPTIAATPMCGRYQGAADETAAMMIWKVAQACGVSPKTILVTMQKEQGLVTKSAPSQWALDHAMGANCPDTAACDPAYSGFFNQVFRGAFLLKRYTDPPGTGPGTEWYTDFSARYAVGKVSQILYHPNSACGTKSVFVKNQATHSLYVYTPYTPNGAALANPHGTGDSCSSYGNRNFWVFWSSWFGSPTSDGAPYGAIASTDTATRQITVHGWAVDPNSFDPITVQLYVDGKLVQTELADEVDDSLVDSYAYYGTQHAYTFTFDDAPSGTHRYCVIGINKGAGGNAETDCADVDVPYCTDSCPTVERLAGADRYSMGVLISQRAFPSTASIVYLASGEKFPDALSASPAAARDGGPLLLTPAGALPSVVAAEIARLDPDRVVIVGGPVSVSPAVEDAVRAIVPDVERLTGADRYEVSRTLAASFGETIPDLYVVNGGNFPDALSADSIAAYLGRPVLLVNGTAATLDETTRLFLIAHGVERITIVGGPVSVSPGIEDALELIGTVTRLAGADRYEASISANRSQFSSAPGVFLASGEKFPDALAGSVLAAGEDSPLYLVRGTCVPEGVVDDIFALGATSVTILGGAATLDAGVADIRSCF
jgi:putative cell wall-binding protein